MKRNSVAKHKPSVLSVSSLIVLLIYSAILVGVLVWILCFSLVDMEKDIVDQGYNWFAAPSFYFKNYENVYDTLKREVNGRYVYIPEMFLNSLLFAGGSALLGSLSPCIVAYATTKFKFKFNGVIDFIVIFTMALPLVGNLPSMIKIVNDLHLNDSFIGLWLLAFNFISMYYFIYKGTYKTVPESLSESAKIDGANQFEIFVRIVLPLVRVTFLSVFVLLFVQYWNNYTTPLAFAPHITTIAYGFYRQITLNTQIIETERMAASFLLIIPMFIMFIVCNKFLMGNLTMGSVKE